MLRRFTDFVLQNRVNAMALAFVIAFIPLIGTVSIIIAAFVTLRKGALEGALVLIAATLPYIISYFVSVAHPWTPSMAMLALAVIVFSNVLTWAFAVILEKFNNWNFNLELAALLGVLIIGVIHAAYPNIENWWQSRLVSYVTKTTELVDQIEIPNDKPIAPNESQLRTISAAKHYATGFVVTAILFNALLQLVIGRWWQAAIFNPGGLRRELHQIRLGYIATFVFILAMIVAYTGNEFAMDALPILYTTFFCAGLSLIHCLLSHRANNWLWLILMYVGIIILFPLSAMIIAMLALFDSSMDFRKRFLL